MKLFPAKTPGFVKGLFPSFVWTIKTEKKELYLTFDDGPTPGITDWVLDILKKSNSKATFFCIGNNIEKHPELFHRIINEGHSIGNHTYNHLKGWKHKTKDYVADVLITEDVINSKFQKLNSNAKDLKSENFEPKILNLKLFRPPYGKLKTKQAKQIQDLGYKIIMWDVLSYDWDVSVSEEKCLENILDSTTKGSVIVFHDSVKASRNLKYVLPKILDYYLGKGYEFKPLSPQIKSFK